MLTSRRSRAVGIPAGHPAASKLSQARAAADRLNIGVANNLEPQREALLALARQVTALAEQSAAMQTAPEPAPGR